MLSIGALAGASAFAAGISSSIPDNGPAVGTAGVASKTLPAQPLVDGQIWNHSCIAEACQGKFESAVLVLKPSDSAISGLQYVRGFGGFHGGGGGFHGFGGGGFHGFGGGGFHGMGGFHGGGFHGMGGFHGFHGFHGGHFHNGHFFNGGDGFFDGDGGWDWGWFGLGLPWIYPWYYDGGYYGAYHPAYYHVRWHHRHAGWCRYHWHRGHRVCIR
ncbi:hypothetical protein C7I85_30190 [Mesorhizobium soli]|uniref:Uncharacterized protein n=1 Tax=Pseudaminobacter soli (ex Li et al. 2025) TaxID=1295366 RepID=A0A2P7RHN5_9HYPH|nr:hypothetical protein C7I85_30190 [Mesorhizobium soli]